MRMVLHYLISLTSNQVNTLRLVTISTLATLAITSCASFYAINPDTNAHLSSSLAVVVNEEFDVAGRFVIKAGDKHNYGNFSWLRNTSLEQLDLKSPLGSVVVRIMIDNINHQIKVLANSKQYVGVDAQAIIMQSLGTSLPLAQMHYWLQGVSLPKVIVQEQLNDGFKQLGWQVEYLEWYYYPDADINSNTNINTNASAAGAKNNSSTHKTPKIIRLTKGDDVEIRLLLLE